MKTVLIDYDSFLKWLQDEERLAGRSDTEWSKEFPNCEQAIWRRGMWYAYRDAGQAMQRFLVNGTWLPTVENINALPEPIRAYIHDLETRADPAGDVRARIVAEDTIRALTTKYEQNEITDRV